MPKVHVEALTFALTWAALAVLGAVLGGFAVGVVLTLGMLVAVMSATMLVLSRTGDLARERQVRWGILAAAAIGLAIYLAVKA